MYCSYAAQLQANREDRGLATRDFQGMDEKREICAPTLQEISSVK